MAFVPRSYEQAGTINVSKARPDGDVLVTALPSNFPEGLLTGSSI